MSKLNPKALRLAIKGTDQFYQGINVTIRLGTQVGRKLFDKMDEGVSEVVILDGDGGVIGQHPVASVSICRICEVRDYQLAFCPEQICSVPALIQYLSGVYGGPVGPSDYVTVVAYDRK